MSKNQSVRWKKEEIVQAVVIADSFNENFVPFSKFYPPCLLPLANRPMLDYTLQCLSTGGVHEVILFCSAFPDQIKQFARKKDWGDLSITVVVSEGCRSFGDAMRDLDAKALIRNDFILVSGFLIGNVNLEALLKKHSEFRKLDQSGQTIAMSLLYKDGGHRKVYTDNEVTFAMDSSTNRILWHNKISSRATKVKIPMELILSESKVDICHGMLDTKLYICSNSIPPLFSDNFDFQTMDDFIKGLLMNEEIIASTLYCHTLEGSNYAATVSNWADYQTITNDVIHRWAYPLVPDTSYKCTFHKRSVYLGKNITLSVGCTLEENVVVGDSCSIGDRTLISNSVLGKDCIIGNDVKLVGCYLFDGVIVEDGCNLSYSLFGDKCKIGKGAILSQGCILGPDVVVDDEKNISAVRLQSSPCSGDGQGKIGSHAYLCLIDSDESDSDSDDEVEKTLARGHGLIFQRPDWKEELKEDESSDSEIESQDEVDAELDDTKIFYNEVLDSLIRGYAEKVPCDNLILEINSSRYAYNVTLRELNSLVIKAVLNLPTKNEGTPAAYWEELKKKVNFFDPILRKYIRNADSQEDCLTAIEDVCEENEMLCEVVMQLLHYVYNKDILYSDPIESWYDNPPDGPFAKQIRAKVKKFIVWLREAESTSGDESGSE